ncbi:hypothetical protein DAEQUDRAFT_280312 [Daedalea quercina L-15889]|uniref:Uncharacterized protein n=1 Tax=Daedalea quercina L-15889 TaxID=1314783 RepID=A0A165Q8W9_9APHY|nr:hypothetical protein DAEQUDRAFT_280312 [Daedalea quercina L-15889]
MQTQLWGMTNTRCLSTSHRPLVGLHMLILEHTILWLGCPITGIMSEWPKASTDWCLLKPDPVVRT